MSEHELAIKFHDTARRALSPDVIDALREQIADVESADSVNAIAAIFAAAGT